MILTIDRLPAPDWQSDCGTVALYCRDCRELLKEIPAGVVDAVVTDPPYGVDFHGKNYVVGESCGYEGGDTDIGPDVLCKVMKLTSRALVFPGNRLCYSYPKPDDIGFIYTPSGAGNGRWGFVVGHLMLFYGKATDHGRRTPSGFTSSDTSASNGHPCPKPERWMVWAVNKATYIGEMVLDPFAGSGTTGVACVRLGRSFIGCEIEPKYFDIAVKRIKAELAQPRLFQEIKQKPEQIAIQLEDAQS